MDNRSFVLDLVGTTSARGHVFLAEVGRLDGRDYLLATQAEPNLFLHELQQTLQQQPAVRGERCDDAVLLQHEQCRLGIACRSFPWLADIVKRCGERDTLIGQQSVWAAGYWLPEALFGDLSIAQPVWGNSDELERLSQQLQPYPEALAHGLASLCSEEIERKSTLSQCDTLEGFIARRDCTIARIRWLFSAHRVYLRSLRNVTDQAAELPLSTRIELATVLSSL